MESYQETEKFKQEVNVPSFGSVHKCNELLRRGVEDLHPNIVRPSNEGTAPFNSVDWALPTVQLIKTKIMIDAVMNMIKMTYINKNNTNDNTEKTKIIIIKTII